MTTWYYRDLKHFIEQQYDENKVNQVKTLDMSYSKIKDMINFHSYFDFYSNKNKIFTIPQEIGRLTQLQMFDFSYNDIGEIPKEIKYLTQLQTIICSFNQIRIIPKEIEYLTQLKTINFEHNQIQNIPKEIKHLTQLTVFFCSNNQINEIPNEISNLTKLQIFECDWNKIKYIPKEIGKITSLQTFNCSNNKIENIPIEISNLIQLKTLQCMYNKIKEIPREICELPQLETLICNNNKIEYIPNEINNLRQLKYFYCNHNQIKEIPIEISNLPHLQSFYCQFNKINGIPKEMGNLTMLKSFICNNNKIKNIPIEIINCVNLRVFEYYNNELEYIQPQINRWLNRNKHSQKIYTDTQSVHNHTIQECVMKSINYITSIRPTIKIEQLKELIINNKYLDEQIKRLLFEYIDNKEIHTILNITFEELLLSIYDFIEKNENKEELYKIMNVEMLDANCKCFTGRISRLINVLNGYDEHIEIHIADNEQISNIIVLIKNQLGEKYNENEFKRLVREELLMRRYSEETINEWIENI